jgi:pimeloyl-ACP methyl ester carboxylesterase
MTIWTRRAAFVALAVIGAALLAAVTAAPTIAAGGLLYPARHRTTASPPAGCVEAAFAGVGVTLAGWNCVAASPRGTVIYLHGIADNHASASGPAARLLARGLNVIAYDSRAHGDSGGEMCTYGFYEKQDLSRVIETVTVHPVIVVGTSLGGAVAIQAAADDERIDGVVAAEVFSDLRTVATERAPFILTDGLIASAFAIAEERGRFRIDDASPRAAASRIRVPVLLIHGEGDVETPPRHSQAVLAALRSPKELLLVRDAGHNQALHSPDAWAAIERFIEARIPSPTKP